jgi:hypothetical protein
MHNGVHDDDASSANAAERTEHSTEIESGMNARFEPWLNALYARRTKHISGTKPRRESGEGAYFLRLLRQPILEETGNAAVSGNFPRRYYPDRVQRDSLSLAARFSVVSRETRAEAPLFRHRSLKHKSETTRKRAHLHQRSADEPAQTNCTALPFVHAARTLAQCREYPSSSAAHE